MMQASLLTVQRGSIMYRLVNSSIYNNISLQSATMDSPHGLLHLKLFTWPGEQPEE